MVAAHQAGLLPSPALQVMLLGRFLPQPKAGCTPSGPSEAPEPSVMAAAVAFSTGCMAPRARRLNVSTGCWRFGFCSTSANSTSQLVHAKHG